MKAGAGGLADIRSVDVACFEGERTTECLVSIDPPPPTAATEEVISALAVFGGGGMDVQKRMIRSNTSPFIGNDTAVGRLDFDAIVNDAAPPSFDVSAKEAKAEG